jgi:hypothetical protein
LRDRQRGTRHRIRARLRLRKGDDLADVLLATEHRDEAVDPDRESTVRGRAIAKRAKEEAEARLGILVADPKCAKHRCLDVTAMDSDAA